MSREDSATVENDSLLPLILAAVTDSSPARPTDDSDRELASDEFTASDRELLAASGSPRELAAKAVATFKARKQFQADRSTRAASVDSTASQPADSTPKCGSSGGYDELLKLVCGFEDARQVSWTSRYRIKKELGRGAQGIVYLIEEWVSGFQSLHALKVFSPQPYKGDASAYREDMHRMAQVASRVHRIRHDSLLEVERFSEQNGVPVMLMQWIDGFDLQRMLTPRRVETLLAYVDRRRRDELNDVVFRTGGRKQVGLKPAIASYIVERCLRALQFLHDAEIVHGDIKPSNIMLDCFGNIKLIDIGSAIKLDAPPRPRWFRTPLFTAPEVLEGGDLSPQSDFASLGYVLLEMLSGRPFADVLFRNNKSRKTGESWSTEQLVEAKQLLPQRFPDLVPKHFRKSDHLMEMCLRLFHPDPRERFSDAQSAIEGPDGTFEFNNQLTRMGLAVCNGQVITRLLTDMKNADRS